MDVNFPQNNAKKKEDLNEGPNLDPVMPIIPRFKMNESPVKDLTSTSSRNYAKQRCWLILYVLHFQYKGTL